jgi:hypothetical protein
VRIELRVHRGCPNARRVRESLLHWLDEIEHEYELVVAQGEYASPSVLVDDRDVMGGQPPLQLCCRVDVPTEADLRAASMGLPR